MINLRSLRCHGCAIRNGQRLSMRAVRSYSSHFSRPSLSINSTSKSTRHPPIGLSISQVRSISLWGWASGTEADFSQLHDAKAGSKLGSALGNDGKILLQQQNSQAKQTIQALEQTSDMPSSSPTLSSSILPLDDAPSLSVTASTPAESTSSTMHHIPGLDLDLNPVEDVANIPERIGYLREVLDLDFGWGPTSMMEWTLEHIHIMTGLPWATSVVALAVSIRLGLFLPIVRGSRMGEKMRAAKPMLSAAQQRMRAAHTSKDSVKMAEVQAEIVAIKREYGVVVWHMILPVVLQIPAGFAAFRLLRNMGEVPVPALVTENFLWMHNLTISDPYLILPIISAVCVHYTIKSGNSTQSAMRPALKSTLSYLLPFLSFVFTFFQPACVQLYFGCSSFLALVQNLLMNRDRFRLLIGLSPHDSSDAMSSSQSPPVKSLPSSGSVTTRKSSNVSATPPAASSASTTITSSSSSPSLSAIQPTTTSRKSSSRSNNRIATSTTKSANSTAPIGPGGLRLYKPTAPPSASSPSTTTSTNARPRPQFLASPSSKRSMIDRFVDGFKARKDATINDIMEMTGMDLKERQKRAARAELAEKAKRWERERER